MQSIRSPLSLVRFVTIRLVDEQQKSLFRIFLRLDGLSNRVLDREVLDGVLDSGVLDQGAVKIGVILARVLQEVCCGCLDTMLCHVDRLKYYLCFFLWKKGYALVSSKEMMNVNTADFCVSPNDVCIRIKNNLLFWGLLEDFCKVFS
jgi:hypothetical protein